MADERKFATFKIAYLFFELVQRHECFLEARRISLQSDVFRRFEKNAIGRNSNKNSKGRFLNFFCEPVMKIQITRL